MQPAFIGIDPGLSKCGYAALDESGSRLALEVVPASSLDRRLEADVALGGLRMICVGHATMSDSIVRRIRKRWPQTPVTVVDETNTSLEARRLYYEDHPPRGLMRLIPRGLLVPNEPLDGYAALLIVRRYLASVTNLG